MCGNQQHEISKLNTIEEAIADFREGKLLIIIDDYDRENEGDFVVAAEKITPETVNFMARYGRGLICVPLTEERCKELDLEMQVKDNTSMHGTPFTVSVDLLGHGCTTGISASDRAKTIAALVDDNTKPQDLGRPGHIFPLRARENGVLRRAGHTEAIVDLARLSNLKPGGALVEIMNEDGTMARLPELIEIAKKFDIKIIAIEDLIKYRLQSESHITKGDTAKLPTKYGDFDVIPFRQNSNGLEHIALIKGKWKTDEAVLVRMHSSCATGDIFGSMRCDCGDQLHQSMKMIEKEGKGVIVYLNQEGRGIGLMSKIAAYKLQDNGLDTVEANEHLGFKADERDYGVGAQILRNVGVQKIKLLSNNPKKYSGLRGYGLEIVERCPIEIESNEFNYHYLETKKKKMGHELNLLFND